MKKRNKNRLRRWFGALLLAAVAVLVLVLLLNDETERRAGGNVYRALDAPSAEAALVLGARVHAGGVLSDMFRDRVDTAIGLYETGKVEKILVSGDHGRAEYDEVNAAKNYLLAQGVSAEDIFLDHAGFDTYDSIYRARDVFRADSVIIVTQGYHLPRALFVAEGLGLEASGVAADTRVYSGQEGRDLREKLATIKAWLDVALGSRPRYLGDGIPLSGDGRGSWD